MIRNKKRTIYYIIMAVFALLLVVVERIGGPFASDAGLDAMIRKAVSCACGSVVFIIAAAMFGYRIFGRGAEPLGKALLFSLPCFCAAINNFPIISVLNGDCRLAKPWYFVAALAAECLMIGLFEEVTFRGVIFLMVLEKRRKTVWDIFISVVITSAVFGVIHLTNILMGAGVGGVIMQIGYSFLIGGMCSVVLIKTRNIWLCALIHGIFDFGGYFLSSVGEGTMWDTATVVLTVFLSVAVAVYVIYALIHTDPAALGKLYASDENG